ncbi:GFA family protein [Roseovarius sp. EL26]|uniref:GFA family protein n=1 Tax=Roseovarius sp. EL26 TaxID=2126672 RepID=UPI000EA0B8A5|nr:GFA family protein [Roseovarius sp. EL26]
MREGMCLCGGVTFEVSGRLADPRACHCKQCRRQTGHYFAAVRAQQTAVRFTKDEGLTWYRPSNEGSLGFCVQCGSTLFWREDESDHIRIALGTLEVTGNLYLDRHIHVETKGDYYKIADTLPQVKGDDI